MLKGKTVILGVTGSIAAYKAANLASMLKKQHADVQVIMTKNATQFMNPITFESLTGNKTLIIIAHRLSTIKNCDVVYEVKDGSVTQIENPEA